MTAIVVVGPDVDEAEAVARGLAASGAPVVLTPDGPPPGLPGLVVDLAVPEAVADALAHAASSWGPVGAIVVLPAPPGSARPVQEIDPDLWAATLEANLTPAMHVCRAATRSLEGSGAIVLVTRRAGAGHAHVAAVGGAVELLARALAVELGPAGIRVNAVVASEVRSVLPTLRLLLSPDAGYLTGEVLTPGLG